MVWAAISWYSAGPIITLHGKIACKGVSVQDFSRVHPMIQTLCPNNDAVLDVIVPILTAETVQSMKLNFSIFLGWYNHHI
jgi:hypothetical protein